MEIQSPLRSSGWFNGSSCCNPPSRHRNLVLAANGRYVIPEAFDIDWLQVVDDKVYTGNGSALSDYFAYGAPVYSVADGTVVMVVDDQPEAPLGGVPNPAVHKPADYRGNEVVVRIAPGKYADYVHLAVGSVRIQVGQHVRAGDIIGELGNTGNSTEPHLHFGIHDSPSPSTASSLPFVIDRYTLERTGVIAPTSLSAARRASNGRATRCS